MSLRNRNRATPLKQPSVFTVQTPRPFGKPTKRGPKPKSKTGRPMKDPNKYAKPFGKDYCWSAKCPSPAKVHPITGKKGVQGLEFHPNYPGDKSKKICSSCYKRYKVTSSVCIKFHT